MGDVTRTVTLVVDSKKTELPGLNDALSKLRKIQGSLHAINASLQNLSLSKIAALGKLSISPTMATDKVAAIAEQIKAQMTGNVANTISASVSDSISTGIKKGITSSANAIEEVRNKAGDVIKKVETFRTGPGQSAAVTKTPYEKTGKLDVTQTVFKLDNDKVEKEKARLAMIERQRAEANQLLEEMRAIEASGFKKHSSVYSKFADTEKMSDTFTRQQKGMREVVKFDFEKESGQLMRGTKSAREFRTEIEKADTALRAANRNLLTNLSHVTTWAASVGVLYGTLGLVRSSTESFIRVGMQTARLSQVFRGVGGDAAELADDVMMLAAAYGRSSTEAMEAAISWSRMGLSRKEASEAVRVSLMAANVAEMDAATATQHMQAIMITYKMAATELAGALGILNDISNKYAVTNNDLLTGISRTAAIAQQAGLSFAELSGIIGATVGATKQSGANIGNAVKSIITAFGNPEIQKFMRNMGVEITAGAGDEIKSFSDTLRDLYLAYEKMSDAEKKYTTYRVAGKTQSSRMQAMLDSYIQSQIRAISAQHNLTSAESENQRIVATLQSQLRGLSAEWDRFVAIQGGGVKGIGPGYAVNNIAQTFKNLLAVMNAPGMSFLTTGFLAAITAISAKMILLASSSKEVGKQFAFVGSTQRQFAATGAAISSLANNYMTGVGAKGGLGGLLYGGYKYGTGIQERSAQTLKDRMYGGISSTTPGIAKALDTLNKYSAGLELGSRSLMIYARSANVAMQAVGGLWRVSTMALAVAKEWAIPMLVIWGLMQALGAATDALGLTMNKYRSSMDSAESKIQQLKNSSEAHLRTVRLLDTAQREMANGNATPERVKKWADAFQGLGGELGNKLSAELKRATGGNVNAIIEDFKTKYLSQAFAAEQSLYEKRKEALEKAQKNLDAQRKKPYAYQTRVVEAEDDVAKKSKELLDSFMRVSDAVSDWAENTKEVQVTLERHKLTLDAIKSIYESLPTGGLGDKNRVNIKMLEAENELEAQKRNQYKLTQEQAAKDYASTSKRRKEIAEEIAAAHERIRIENARSGYAGPNMDAIGRAREQISKLEKESSGLWSPSALANEKAREASSKSIERTRELEAQIEARRKEQAAFDKADRLSLAGQYASFQNQSGAFGYNPTDRLRNEGRNILEQSRQNRLLAAGGDENAKRMLYQNYQDLQANILKLVERRVALEAEEKQLIIDKRREYEKALMLSGPADMLKRLAAFRMAKSGTGMGGFLAMTPDIREMMGQVNPMRYSHEGMGLRRERAEAEGLTGDLTLKKFQEIILEIRRMATDALNGLRLPELPDTAAFIDLTKAMTGATTATVAFATSVSIAQGKLDSIQVGGRATIPAGGKEVASLQTSPQNGGGFSPGLAFQV